jgi:hypothetical protein
MKARYLPLMAVLALAGCSKIHEQRSFTMEPGSSNNLKITAPLSETKYKVEMTSDQPVNLWVLLEKDVPGGKDEFDPEPIQAVLGKEKNTQQATLNVTVPAKEKFRVYINGPAKTANVTVKIDSQ